MVITSLPVRAEAIGNPLLGRFIQDLIVQILAMIAEQERTESKRRQEQGIKIAQNNGGYKGRPILYSAFAKDPQKRSLYKQIVGNILDGIPISEIARDRGITRQTAYRLKKEIESEKFS